MISPHTPPGTLVIYNYNGSVKSPNHIIPKYKGIYTVVEIVPTDEEYMGHEYGVILKEIRNKIHPKYNREYNYAIATFDYAELPKCLTEILERAPILEKV